MSVDANLDSCRVCHQEGSPHRPLFQPCQCDGSMRHVHQDCLVAWLRYSGRRSCEVCNQPFSFNGGHKNSTTAQGATIQTIITGVKQALMIVGSTICAMFFLIFAWFVAMPLGTVNAIAHYFGYNLGYFFMPMTILKSVLGGLVITGFTIVVVVSFGLLRQFLRSQRLLCLVFHKGLGAGYESRNEEGLTKEESERFFDSVIGEMMLPSGQDYSKIAHHMTPAERQSLESQREILQQCTHAEQRHFLARYRIVNLRKKEWEALKKEAEAKGEPYPDYEEYLGTFKAVTEGREDVDHPYHGLEGWKSRDLTDPQKLLFALTQPSFCREFRCNTCHSCFCLDVQHTYRCSRFADEITRKKLANALAMGLTREQFALQLCEFRRLRFLGKAILFEDITTPISPNAPILKNPGLSKLIPANAITPPTKDSPLTAVNAKVASATPAQIRQLAQRYMPKEPAPVIALNYDFARILGYHGLNLMAPLNATVMTIVNILIVLLLVAWPHSIATYLINLVSMIYTFLISSPIIDNLLTKLISMIDSLPSSTSTIAAALTFYHWISPITTMASTVASIVPLRVILGHLVIASAVKSYLLITSHFRTRQQMIPFEDSIVGPCIVYLKALKLVILFALELIAQPFCVGVMMDLAVLPVTGATVAERVTQANSHPILFSLAHVAAGWAVLRTEYTMVAKMRGFFREGFLHRLRNPQDPNRVLVKEMIQSSWGETIWGCGLFVIRQAMIVGLFLAAPVAAMVEVMPTLLPMSIPSPSPSALNQLPLDALLQLVAKHFGDALYALLFVSSVPWVIKMLARSLRLSSYLFGGRFSGEENLASGGRYVFVPASNIRYPAKIAEMMASREVTPLEVAHMGEGGKRRDPSGPSALKTSFCVVYQPAWFMVRFGLLMTLTWLWVCLLGAGAFMSCLFAGRMLWTMFGGVADDSKAFAFGIIAVTSALKVMVYLLSLVPSIPFRRCLNGLGMAAKLILFSAFVGIVCPLLVGSLALFAIHVVISQADPCLFPAAIVINSWALGVVLLYFGYQLRRTLFSRSNCRRYELAVDWRSWPGLLGRCHQDRSPSKPPLNSMNYKAK